jgi:hypothetical protein
MVTILEKIRTLSLDLETYSDVDLAKAGVYKYAESPNFEILLLGASINTMVRLTYMILLPVIRSRMNLSPQSQTTM